MSDVGRVVGWAFAPTGSNPSFDVMDHAVARRRSLSTRSWLIAQSVTRWNGEPNGPLPGETDIDTELSIPPSAALHSDRALQAVDTSTGRS